MAEQAETQKKGMTRRSFVGWVAAGAAGAIAAAAASGGSPLRRLVGKKSGAASGPGPGSLFRPRDPRP